MPNNKSKVAFFLVSLWVDIVNLTILFIGIYAFLIYPVFEGKNLFSLNYWAGIINSGSPIYALKTVAGFCIFLYYVVKRLPVHYKLPFLTVFTSQGISLYSIFGNRKIEWNNIALFEAKRIENTEGRDDGMLIKIVEVQLILKSMEAVKFQLDTYSQKKLDMIYQLKGSAKD
jgi:hypothetical protein